MNPAVAIHAIRRQARGVARVAAVITISAVAGCATGPDANPKDPLEPFNRKMFAFNDALDSHLVKPVAVGYTKVVPQPVRTGIHNFFGNFTDVWSTVNQLLQGKFENTARMTARVFTNTFMGFGGLFDPATDMGLEKKPEDLGQTLGRWGLPPGPYLVLPLFGPSDVRDAIALPADDYVTPALLVDGTGNKLIVDAVGLVDARANLLGATDLLDDIALDRYTFLRDAYVTRRRSLVYDGNPPDQPDDDAGEAPAPGTPASGAALSAPASGAVPALPAASAPASAAPASAAHVSSAHVSSGHVYSGHISSAPVSSPPVSSAISQVSLLQDKRAQQAPRPYAVQVSPRRDVQEQPQPPSAASAPGLPMPSVSPAPLPASAPSLPVPPSGPVPVPPPPASAAR